MLMLSYSILNLGYLTRPARNVRIMGSSCSCDLLIRHKCASCFVVELDMGRIFSEHVYGIMQCIILRWRIISVEEYAILCMSTFN